MKIIEKMIDDIMEEVEGAREYAEKYIEAKARGNMSRAMKYKQMAHDEMAHAETVYEFAENDIEALKRVYTLSADDEEAWEHAKKKMHHCIATIKTYVA